MDNKGLWISIAGAMLLAVIIGAILYGMFLRAQTVPPQTFTY